MCVWHPVIIHSRYTNIVLNVSDLRQPLIILVTEIGKLFIFELVKFLQRSVFPHYISYLIKSKVYLPYG